MLSLLRRFVCAVINHQFVVLVRQDRTGYDYQCLRCGLKTNFMKVSQ